METVKLCTCNNCGSVFIDTNPGDTSLDYPIQVAVKYQLPHLRYVVDVDDNEDVLGCDRCNTDGYLQDNINYAAGGTAKLMEKYFIVNKPSRHE